MSLKSLVLASLPALLAAAAPASASTVHLGRPTTIPVPLDRHAEVTDAISGEHRDTALVVRVPPWSRGATVLHRAPHGRWRRFHVGGSPEIVRLALLRHGGLAVWDDGDAVLSRGWDAAGRVGAVHRVLTGVTTIYEADWDAPQWQLSSDDRGTVVVASATPAGAVVAAVRDPGGFFRPQVIAGQVHPTFSGPSEPQQLSQPELELSPIAANGTVTVRWGRHAARGEPGFVPAADLFGQATRTGRAATFDPPTGPAPPGTPIP